MRAPTRRLTNQLIPNIHCMGTTWYLPACWGSRAKMLETRPHPTGHIAIPELRPAQQWQWLAMGSGPEHSFAFDTIGGCNGAGRKKGCDAAIRAETRG